MEVNFFILLEMNTRKPGSRDTNASKSPRKTGAKPTGAGNSKPRAAGKPTSKSDSKSETKPSLVGASKTRTTGKVSLKPSGKPDAKSDAKPNAKSGSFRIDPRTQVRKGDPLPSFNEDEIRLNKYLSNAGVCSRREADVLIQSGVVSINGKIVTEMGYKIKPGDKVQYDGETINAETKRYVLLNKPKDFITTMDDPWGRKTVMGLVFKACKERIYPVGRLDRDTTGLLLFTNDGDLAKKLTHPRYQAKKIYQVELDKTVSLEHLELLKSGIELEDGRIAADHVEYVKDGKSSREVGIEIHSGKNRIVRRMFEKLGYVVVKLDRVQFASLTKKDLPRGFYRHLTDKEVAFLKMSK